MQGPLRINAQGAFPIDRGNRKCYNLSRGSFFCVGKGKNMPEISRFYGIVIKMFFKPKEHEPSHLHALYGERVGVFDLRTMTMTEGDLPKRAQELVAEWMAKNQDKLLEMWDTQKLEKLPPL